MCRCRVLVLPADTSTTAMKSAISSGSSPKDPSFSLKSNMASSKDPMPRARSDASEYVCPLRNVTVLSLGSNNEQNLTIRTCGYNKAKSGYKNTQKGKKVTKKVTPKTLLRQMYLEGARFEQHDLIMLTESLEARDALCKLHHFFNSRGEALREGLPYLLTGATRRRHRT